MSPTRDSRIDAAVLLADDRCLTQTELAEHLDRVKALARAKVVDAAKAYQAQMRTQGPCCDAEVAGLIETLESTD